MGGPRRDVLQDPATIARDRRPTRRRAVSPPPKARTPSAGSRSSRQTPSSSPASSAASRRSSTKLDSRIADIVESGIERGAFVKRVTVPRLVTGTGQLVQPVREWYLPVTRAPTSMSSRPCATNCALDRASRQSVPAPPARTFTPHSSIGPTREGSAVRCPSASNALASTSPGDDTGGDALGRQVAEYLGIPVNTLYQWRHKGFGPEAYRVGQASALRTRQCSSIA